MAGAIFFIWKELPTFEQLLLSPGVQLANVPYDDLTTIGTLLAMQVAYWYRLRRIPIPFQRSNLVLSHLFLFLGRLSFIFGGALFSVVFFRHLLELDHDADFLLMTRRAVLLCGFLFRAVLPGPRIGAIGTRTGKQPSELNGSAFARAKDWGCLDSVFGS